MLTLSKEPNKNALLWFSLSLLTCFQTIILTTSFLSSGNVRLILIFQSTPPTAVLVVFLHEHRALLERQPKLSGGTSSYRWANKFSTITREG